MTMKVKAIEKKLKFSKDPNDPGVYRYVMRVNGQRSIINCQLSARHL